MFPLQVILAALLHSPSASSLLAIERRHLLALKKPQFRQSRVARSSYAIRGPEIEVGGNGA